MEHRADNREVRMRTEYDYRSGRYYAWYTTRTGGVMVADDETRRGARESLMVLVAEKLSCKTS